MENKRRRAVDVINSEVGMAVSEIVRDLRAKVKPDEVNVTIRNVKKMINDWHL